jgi:hypothetical protein
MLSAAALYAGDAPAPGQPPPPPPSPPVEVSWDAIETWAAAGGEPAKVAEASPAGKGDAKTPDVKAPGPAPLPEPAKPQWTPQRPGMRRPEPAQISEVRQAFAIKGVYSAERAEKSRDYERAFLLYDRLQRYQQAAQQLLMMKNDQKRYAWRELWIKEKWIELGLLLGQSRQDMDAAFKDFKEARLAKNAEIQDKGARERDMYDLNQREEMLNAKPTLPEFLIKREVAGDGDPAALWDLSGRLSGDRPHDPLRHISVLYKLREWYPDFEHVKGGEVQWRLACDLAGRLELNKEAADEAHALCENYPKHNSVLNGDALWMECEHRRFLGTELDSKSKSQAIEVWRVARDKYKEFQAKYPNNGHNHANRPGNPKSECQEHLEDLNGRVH